jgi:DNA (cytosine-5)-methyltransferase 1
MARRRRVGLGTQVIELFAGAGGFTWGWKRAGFQPVAAVEIDSAAARTHELNFHEHHTLTLNRDINELDPKELESLLGCKTARLFAVTGGPPCQGWSKVGRGKLRSLQGRAVTLLNDPRNSLYRRFVEYVAHFKPAIYVMENVPGMLNLEGRNVAAEVAANFSEIGYNTTFSVVNARWFGVPQDRLRLIFIGVRSDLSFGLDARELKEFGPEFRGREAGLPGETTLRRAIADLPPVPHGTREDPQPYRRRRGRIARFADLMRDGSNGLVMDHICREHNDQDLEAFSRMPQGGIYVDLPPELKRYRDDIFPDKYRKLRWDAVSGTITAHLAKDCYTHIHPEQQRTITIREAARLQSFPDSFRFYGNMGDRFRQIGNAVPPLMAWGIASYIRDRLPRSFIDS